MVVVTLVSVFHIMPLVAVVERVLLAQLLQGP
jgi:hypothetical protein